MKVFSVLCQCEDEWEQEVSRDDHNLNLHGNKSAKQMILQYIHVVHNVSPI